MAECCNRDRIGVKKVYTFRNFGLLCLRNDRYCARWGIKLYSLTR